VSVFGIGPLEILLIAALALVVFGPDRLPEIARQVGKVLGDVRRTTNELTGEFQRALDLDGPGVARPRTPPGRTILPPNGKTTSTTSPGSTPEDEPLRPPY
jgi:Tat protein translocase TatB subunit